MEGKAPLSPPERAARTAVIGLALTAAAFFMIRPVVQYLGVLFAGGLLALALGSVAALISKRTRLPQAVALGLVLAVLFGGWAALGAWMGPVFAEQFAQLDEAVPRGIAQARGWLEQSDAGQGVIHRLESAQDEMGGSSSSGIFSIGRGLATGFDALAEALVLLFFGFFLAAAPRAYVHGALLLLPPAHRTRAGEVLEAIARALRLWLLARMALMCFVGVAFGIGLFALDVPLALPLAFLAGALGFIPFLGPTLAFIPAFAVALLESPETAFHVTLLYLGIQFVEGNLLEPVVESRTVSLRPGLLLVGQVLAAIWFGPIGVLIASPLVVIVVVLVQMLYLQDRLGEDIVVIGQPKPREVSAPPPVIAEVPIAQGK